MPDGAKLLFISVPGLSEENVQGGAALFLKSMADDGDTASLVSGLPATSCTSHAGIFTGGRPADHGMVADAYYERVSHEVICKPQYVGAVAGAKFWDLLKARQPRALTALLFFEQTKYSKADIIITPDPVIMEDGGLLPRCYSRPRSLFPEMEHKLRWFDLESFEGRRDLQYSMRWVSGAVEYILKEFKPRLTMVKFPQLEYATAKFGPDSRELRKVLSSLDAFLGHIIQIFKNDSEPTAVVIASPYSGMPVSRAVYINRILRQEGYLSVHHIAGREMIDFESSKAFAVTDYQAAHIYCGESEKEEVSGLLKNTEGIQTLLDSGKKSGYGLNHPRSGEFVALAEPDSWFTYNWWFDDHLAPTFPRQGSRLKPGLDPLELFMEEGEGYADMPTDVSLVKGSHGLIPDYGGKPGIIICDDYASSELKINRLEITEVFSLLGHIMR